MCVCDSEAPRVVYSRSDRSIALPSRENGTMLSGRSPRSASRKGGHEISWQYPFVFFLLIVVVLVGNYESLMVTKMTGKGPRNALVENSFTGGDDSVISSAFAKEEAITIDEDGDENADVESNRDDDFSSSSSSNSNNNNNNNNNNGNQLSAIAVGNGASSRHSRFGQQVDANDVVLRFNLFKTIGFELDVGTKTTHWILSTIKDPNDFDEEEIPNLKKSLQHVYIPFVFRDCKPQQVRCPRRKDKIPKQKQRMHELETIATNWLKKNDMRDVKVHAVEAPQVDTLYEEYNLNEKFPSMGLMFLNYAWRKFKQPVQFCGFDFYSGSHDHYWERKLKNETCHNMNDESRVLSEFVKENKLKALDKKAHEVLINYKSPDEAEYDPRCKIVCNTDESNLFCLTLRGREVDAYNNAPEQWERRHGIHSAYVKKTNKKKRGKG